MDNDDAIIGRVLGRRELMLLAGGLGLAAVVGCSDSKSSSSTPAATNTSGATTASGSTTASSTTASGSAVTTAATTAATTLPACVVVPALTEGPYFVEEKLNRSDIRPEPTTGVNKDGAVLALTFQVSAINGSACGVLANANVDVWHCDAVGVYSDATDPSFNTKGQKWLRGYQTTDATGKAAFTTIYPGWYQGRAVHIHFKIRGTRADGKTYDFTSQLFFDDAFSDSVYAAAPYSSKGKHTLLNANDDIYKQSKGQTLVKVTKTGNTYATTFDVGLQLS